MPRARFVFDAPLWEYHGSGAWHFVSLPPEVSDEIADLDAGPRTAFGSVRVTVTVGATTWSTSVFPDRKSATYLLPVKKSVRQAELLTVGDVAKVELVVD